MKTTELTDIDGDALTITQRLDATWITCTKGAEEVTIGPVPTGAVRHAFQEPMGGDDMDGGVTAAAIEAEVVSPDQARSLVQERDELLEALDTTLGRARRAEQERDEADRRTAEAEAQRDQWKRHHDRVDGQWAKAEREVTKLRAERDKVADLFGAALDSEDSARMETRAVRDAQRRPLTADGITDEYAARVVDLLRKRGHGTVATHYMRSVLEAAVEVPRPEGAEELAELLRGFPGPLAGIRDISDHLAARGVRVTGAEA